MHRFKQKTIDEAFNFEGFRQYTEEILTGENKKAPYHQETYIQYTQLNHQRAEKILRNFQLDKRLYNEVNQGIQNWTWILLNEPWCGDGSFAQPVLEAIATASSGQIKLKILLRDSNKEIMDQYLTNGGQAIPKLVCLDQNLNELGTWGPRPKLLQQEFLEWKQEEGFDINTKIKKINRWYIKDKGQAMQKEFIDLIKEWKKTQHA